MCGPNYLETLEIHNQLGVSIISRKSSNSNAVKEKDRVIREGETRVRE